MAQLIIPSQGEFFIQVPDDPPSAPYTAVAWGEWYPSDAEPTRLLTPDEGATYGRILSVTTGETRGVGIGLDPYDYEVLKPPGFVARRAFVDYQARSDGPVLWRVTLGTHFGPVGSFVVINSEDTPTTGWHKGRLELFFIDSPTVWGHFLTALAGGLGPNDGANGLSVWVDPLNVDGFAVHG